MKSLSEPFIRRPVMTTLMVCSILFFGIFSYLFLPVSDLPTIEYPTILVKTDYPGMSPDTIANTITAPLEREFAQIEKVNNIYSTSSNGSSQIMLEFTLDKSLEVAAQDVQSKINAALSYLPSDLPNQPYYQKVNPTASPVMYYGFASDTIMSPDIYKYVDGYVSRRISMISGVSEVDFYGSEYAVRVQVDPDKLAARGISLNEVADTIQTGNVELPTGTIYGPLKEYSIFTDGELYDGEGFEKLIVRNEGGDMVRISDVGRAINSATNDKQAINYTKDGKVYQAIAIGIKKMFGANTLQVIDKIKALMPSAVESIPSSIKVIHILDQSKWIFESIHDVQLTLLIAFLLVAAVTFFYLGKVIDAIIPIIVLPISIIGSFACMYLAGFTFDILSLLAMTLAIGFLVDDAIVVLENTVRHLEEGKSRFQAAIEGAKQISFTVLSMTLSLIAVFIPMLFMPGLIGRLFTEFAAVIMMTVLISGFLSLTLTPLLCSRFLSPHKEENKSWLERTSEKINSLFQNSYRRVLRVVLRHRLLTLFGGTISLAATVFLTMIVPKDFIPPSDLGVIECFVKFADSTSPFETIKKTHKIAKILEANPYVDNVMSIGGAPTGNQSMVFANLVPLDERPSIFKLQYTLKELLKDIPGVQVFMRPFPLIDLSIGTGMSKGDYQFSLQSFDKEKLYKAADEMLLKLSATTGLTQVTSDSYNHQPQINIAINRDKASNYNLTAQDIENTLGYAFGGTKISQIYGAIDQYDVLLETLPKDYKEPSDLEKLYVGTEQVPLSEVVDWTESVGPLQISHLNTMDAVTLSFDVKDIPLSEALNKVEEIASDTLPQDVHGSVQGTASVFKKTFSTLAFLIIITIFVIYVILGILYENFIHPITVMSALPPAAMGGLLTLLIFNEPLSLYSFVGMIMLLGIVLKNGIILVDFAVEGMREMKMGIEEAIEHACITRFRPILMTTIAALMGVLPIAIGAGGATAASRRPLGMVIVGGLIFSQILTLFLTPVVFIYLEKMRRFFSSRSGVKPVE